MLLKKKFLVIASLIILVTIGVAAHKPETDPDNGFKNLKVLPKDISQDSLNRIMHGFGHALGVHCTFCHAENKDNTSGRPDFASDEKPEKEIARKMMLMTTSINETYFNFNGSAQPDTITVVHCQTCHRGNPHPDEEAINSDDHNEMNHNAPPPNNQPPQ